MDFDFDNDIFDISSSDINKNKKIKQEQQQFDQFFIKKPTFYKKNILLLLSGSFYPLHNGHLKILELSISYLEKIDEFFVLGGLLLPFHKNVLKRKYGKKNLINDEKRQKLYENGLIGLKDILFSDFIMNKKNNLGVSSAIKMIEKKINNNFKRTKKDKIQIVTLQLNEQKDEFELLKMIDGSLILKTPYLSLYNSQNIRLNIENHKYNDLKLLIPNETLYYIKILNLIFQKQEIKQKNTESNNKNNLNINESLENILQIPLSIPIIDITQLKNPENNEILLGKGCQSLVYEKIWENKKYAVKITNISEEKTRKIKSCARDLKALLLCNHPNIIKCYFAGFTEKTIFYGLELGLKGNPWDYVTNQRKKWPYKLISKQFIIGLVDLSLGLHYMSEKGILHRDLTLNNLIFFEQNDDIIIKINDFGVSQLIYEKESVVRGSTRHYAPESIINKDEYTSKSDVFSFGNLIFEIVNGRKVFSGCKVDECHKKLIDGEKPKGWIKIGIKKEKEAELDNSENNEEIIKNYILILEKIKILVDKCWEFSPNNRPNFNEIAQELKNISLLY